MRAVVRRASAIVSLLASTWLPVAMAAPPGVDEAVAPTPSEQAGGVRGYLMNEFGEVDGIVAVDGGVVRFPPHMSRDLVATLKPGDRFVAFGQRLPGGSFQAYTLGKPGAPPLAEARPTSGVPIAAPRDVRRAGLVPISASGAIVAIVRNRAGDVDGVVIDDGTNVRLPPGAVSRQGGVLRIGASIGAVGFGTRNAWGQSLRAEQLGFDGQPPSPLQPEGPRLRPGPPPPAPGPPP